MNIPVIIPNGTALAGQGDFVTAKFIGFIMPAAWTAADITIRVSNDGTNFFNLIDQGGTEVALTVAAASAVGFDQDTMSLLSRWRWFILRSGTASVPVNQLAERTINLVGRDVA